ncbi:MAG: hypothetical protein A3F18_06405 [Legionellales bacterium RIFCSPHIGHO2_12_FULL_37_14]|nr:MAG: hypothetical protein A3F18_06405 [Legionellales bacterium RIFCSPHIGHO2_12_FULL_37_14]
MQNKYAFAAARLLVVMLSCFCLPLLAKDAASYAVVKSSKQWLVMADKVPLSVTYWFPKPTYPGERFSTILEVLPYRKDDSFFERDANIQGYFARHGFVVARVDVRGTGSSKGVLPPREYSDIELQDIREIIEQLAKKPWSNGRIGMQGISWGAFNSLMTAMKNPPALKGLLVAHGSEDLYANDIHQIDGALHIDIFSLEIDTDNAFPLSPSYPIDAEYFKDRFNQIPSIFNYLQHQRDGVFWQKHSIANDYSSIQIPVYAFGSLLDGYRDFAINLFNHLKSFVKIEIGPQNHAWPTGKGEDWKNKAVRWWKTVLNQENTGILDEPRMRVFIRDPVHPTMTATQGYYAQFFPPKTKTTNMILLLKNDKQLATKLEGGAKPVFDSLVYRPAGGKGVLNWWGETTPDMQNADKDALVYDSNVLTKDSVVLGNPRVELNVAASAPLADWIVRLEDVFPDGRVAFITGGLINGAQRVSRVLPTAILKNQFFRLKFPLHFTTWRFKAGHRIRVSVSNAQFPMIWPTPYSMVTQLAVNDGTSYMELPIIVNVPPEDKIHKEEVILAPPAFNVKQNKKGDWLASSSEGYRVKLPDDASYQCHYTVTYKVSNADPAKVSFIGYGNDTVNLPKQNRKIEVQFTLKIDSDKQFFHVKAVRRLLQNGRILKTKTWQQNIPRDFQ